MQTVFLQNQFYLYAVIQKLIAVDISPDID